MSSASTEPAVSPYDGLKLSLDARALDPWSSTRRLKAVGPDGELILVDPKPPTASLTEHLERIWNEYPAGLLDLTEAALEAVPPDTVYGDDDEEDEAPQKPAGGRGMTVEDMEALRSEVCAQLNDARNELWFMLELAKTLASSSAYTASPPDTKPKPPPPAPATGTDALLPPGTYSTTPGQPPAAPAHISAHALQASLSSKRRAVDDCLGLLDAAVGEMRTVEDAGRGFWRSLRAMREGKRQWAVVPRPDYGRTGDATARDVVFPYALDEAAAPLRARSLAAFDLDPAKKDVLVFGARSYLRLRVLVSGDQLIGSAPYDAGAEDAKDALALLEAAQREAVDEELFNELRIAGTRMEALVEPRKVTVKLGAEEIVFELYSTLSTPSLPTTPSPLADLLLAQLHLQHLHLLRRRKQRLIGPDPRPGRPPAPPVSLVGPLLQGVLFLRTLQRVGPTLDMLRDTCGGAGIASAVGRHFSVDVDALVVDGAAEAERVGAVLDLELAECKGATVTLTAPALVHVATSAAAFPLRDAARLADVLADDLGRQLTRWACRRLGDDAEYDELEGCAVAGQAGRLVISIPAPFDRVVGTVEHGEAYDSKTGVSLAEWLAGVKAGAHLANGA